MSVMEKTDFDADYWEELADGTGNPDFPDEDNPVKDGGPGYLILYVMVSSSFIDRDAKPIRKSDNEIDHTLLINAAKDILTMTDRQAIYIHRVSKKTFDFTVIDTEVANQIANEIAAGIFSRNFGQ